MPLKRLTEANVRTLECPAGEERVIYFDTAKTTCTGFGLRVTSTARATRAEERGREGGGTRWSGRAYVLKFFVKGTGARGSITLGNVGDITLDDARKMADEKSKLAAAGRDPRYITTTNKTRTVAAVVADYIDAIRANAAVGTVDSYERLILHVQSAPELRGPIHAIEDTHVAAMCARLGASNGHYAANRTFNLIASSLRWARGTRKSRKKVTAPTPEQRIARNPCAEMTAPFNESKREHWLPDSDAVRLWRALEDQPAEVAAYVRFIILAATRRNETAKIHWSDFNEAEKYLVVPGKRGKETIRKGGRSHVVFLAPLALDVLRSIGPGKPDEPIFGAGGLQFITNESRMLTRLRRATEVRDPETKKVVTPAVRFTPHDLRRTCATGCARMGADETMISRILGHAVFSGALPVTLQYIQHKYAGEHRAALERWAAHLDGLLGIKRKKA
jgi:integrase